MTVYRWLSDWMTKWAVVLGAMLIIALIAFAFTYSGRAAFRPESTEYYVRDREAFALTWTGTHAWRPWAGELAVCSLHERPLARAHFDNYAADVLPWKLSFDKVETYHLVCRPRFQTPGAS